MDGDACAHHPKRAALTVCVNCERAVCRECLVATRVGVKCQDCSGATSAGRAGRQKRSRRRLGLGVGLVAVLLIAGVAVTLGRDDEQPRAASSAGDGGTRSEEVTFAGADGFTLHGTLDLPRDIRDQGQPGVVIVPGIGATTREGVIGDEGHVDTLYADLGETLAQHGFVVLRYDKRGVGDSTPLPAGSETVFDHHVEDAADGAAFLGGREEVDASDVAVIGHGQGGLVGMRLAAADTPEVAGLALISTPGRPLHEAVADEIRSGFFASGEEAEELAAEFTDAADELLATGEVPDVSERLQPILPAESASFLASVFALEPTELAGEVEVPVLIARGEHDPGVHERDVERLRSAFTAAPAVEVLRVPGAGSTLADLSRDEEAEGSGHEGDGEDAAESSRGMAAHPEAVAPWHPRDEDALRRMTQWLRSELHG